MDRQVDRWTGRQVNRCVWIKAASSTHVFQSRCTGVPWSLRCRTGEGGGTGRSRSEVR